jgi:hypothetical protein
MGIGEDLDPEILKEIEKLKHQIPELRSCDNLRLTAILVQHEVNSQDGP